MSTRMQAQSTLPALTPKEVSHFWSRVHRPLEPDACWPWLASFDGGGYGKIGFRGNLYAAHRLAFELGKGYPPLGEVRHLCHNRACCNPGHLDHGTHAENMQDSLRAGRLFHPARDRPECMPRGEKSPHAKLKESQVKEIRALVGAMSYRAVARYYGVSESLVRLIALRKLWRHVE